MDNIYKLESHASAYIQKSFDEFYNLGFWRNAAVAEDTNPAALLPLFDVFGNKLKPTHVTTKVEASPNEWDPCCTADYQWKIKEFTITIRLTLVCGKIQFVSIADMQAVLNKFGESFDFAHEFEKNIVLINELKK
jgi:hypothetical protein